MSVVQKNSRPRLIPVTRKPAATPQQPTAPTSHIRLAGNGGVMVVGPLTPYLPAGFASAIAATFNTKGR